MNKKLVIMGAGGHGKVCANVAEDMNMWDEIVFLDDHKQGAVNGHKIIGKIEIDHLFIEDADYFVGLGDNNLREKFITKLRSLKASIVTLIHPTAYMSQFHSLGEGTVVMPHGIVNVSARIGSGVIINSGAIIEHDVVIEDFVHVSPGVILTGGIKIGSRVWLGSGLTLINSVTVAEDVVIGANSLVLNDIDNPGTYVGNPIKKIK